MSPRHKGAVAAAVMALAATSAVVVSLPAAALGAPPSAAAREGAMTGGLDMGAYLSGLGVGGRGQNIAPGTLVRVRGGFQVSHELRLELELGEVFTSIQAVTPSAPRAGAFLALAPLFAEARYDFLVDGVLVPFLHGGFGALLFVPGDRDIDGGGSARFGAGAEYFVNDWLGFRLDLSQILYKGSSPFADHAAEFTSNYEISFGIDVLAGGGTTRR